MKEEERKEMARIGKLLVRGTERLGERRGELQPGHWD